jgi:hypothetical protein
VDRDAIVRSRRREDALDALDFERQREQALAGQIDAIVVEEDGPRVDEQVFARMEPDDVALVRELLGNGGWVTDEDRNGWPDEAGDEAEDTDTGADEIARLEGEIAECRRRQQALERFIEALGA